MLLMIWRVESHHSLLCAMYLLPPPGWRLFSGKAKESMWLDHVPLTSFDLNYSPIVCDRHWPSEQWLANLRFFCSRLRSGISCSCSKTHLLLLPKSIKSIDEYLTKWIFLLVFKDFQSYQILTKSPENYCLLPSRVSFIDN